jgi:hypothetical protein
MLSSYFLNLVIIYLLVDFVKIWYLYANILLIIVLTPYNYLLHRNWSFRKKQIKKIPPQGAGYGNRLLANRWFPLQAYIFRPKGRGITPKLLLKSSAINDSVGEPETSYEE